MGISLDLTEVRKEEVVGCGREVQKGCKVATVEVMTDVYKRRML